ADLVARYGEPHRHYHTLDHVDEVLRTVRALCEPGAPRPALLLAAWFHDVIYDPRAGDNEERSAAHARAVLEPLGVPADAPAETTRLILLTRDHTTTAEDVTGHVLLDADLAALGASPERYDAYSRAIRQEYGWVPEGHYRQGRTRVLRGFLGRPRIYLTERMFTLREESARSNLRREVATLLGGA